MALNLPTIKSRNTHHSNQKGLYHKHSNQTLLRSTYRTSKLLCNCKYD